jgi:copper chaperone
VCGCSTDKLQSPDAAQRCSTAISFQVDDMACSHCASTIKKVIESSLPGTIVEVDPASGIVSVLGSSDLTSIRAVVSAAGYTPTVA